MGWYFVTLNYPDIGYSCGINKNPYDYYCRSISSNGDIAYLGDLVTKASSSKFAVGRNESSSFSTTSYGLSGILACLDDWDDSRSYIHLTDDIDGVDVIPETDCPLVPADNSNKLCVGILCNSELNIACPIWAIYDSSDNNTIFENPLVGNVFAFGRLFYDLTKEVVTYPAPNNPTPTSSGWSWFKESLTSFGTPCWVDSINANTIVDGKSAYSNGDVMSFDSSSNLYIANSTGASRRVDITGAYPLVLSIGDNYDAVDERDSFSITLNDLGVSQLSQHYYTELKLDSIGTRPGIKVGIGFIVNETSQKAKAVIIVSGEYFGNRTVAFTVEDYRSDTSSVDSAMTALYTKLNGNIEPDPPAPTTSEFKFYSFNKKVNSTKQPSSGTVLEGRLKKPFNIMMPEIDIYAANDQFNYNYMSWKEPGSNLTRYYWIQQKTWFPNHIVSLQCEEDTLATFKAPIRAMSPLVMRSASRCNPYISDTSYLAQNGIDLHTSTISPLTDTNGFYVVGIANPDKGIAEGEPEIAIKGGVSYYAAKPSVLKDLITWLTSDASTGEWADYNPMSRIVSVKYIPIQITWYTPQAQADHHAILFWHTYVDPTSGETLLNYFDWDLTQLPNITGTTIIKDYAMNIFNHPQIDANRTYLNYRPFREIEFKAGPFGIIEVPIEKISVNDTNRTLGVRISIDLLSGLSRLEITGDMAAMANTIYFTENYCCSIDIAISQATYDKYSDILQMENNRKNAIENAAVSAISGAGGLVAAAVGGNGIFAARGVTSLIQAGITADRGNRQYMIDAYNTHIPVSSMVGSNGSWLSITDTWYMITRCYFISGDAGEIIGRPLGTTAALNSLSGYTLCNQASFSNGNANIAEINQINDFLNSGFYLE